ncbi:uncharacterized protein LOC107857881 [Capsicum annuum]|uniref:uncharacterized protein LOC107857881 n=1 Tax=Capsicum annuum TaxID=4072 RepID=UPI001FB073DA|nr:uncharacterized protein LOC107857881 [Capsicum annuum]
MRDKIFLVRKLPRFAPYMCSYSDNDIYGRIRAILNKEQFKNFCKNNIFGYFMKKKNKQCVVQAQLCRCVMTLEVKGNSSSGIMISANDTFLSFTPMEFAIIIGLSCVSNRNCTEKATIFSIHGESMGENNDEDAEKFAILYFLHSFVLSNIGTVVIPRLYFDLVDSGRNKDFPWGSLSFEDLARSLNNRLKVGGKFYLIQGMPLSIQVWLYECCSNVPPKIALKVENRISRLLNWKTIAPRPRYEVLMNAMFKDNDKVVFKNIEPTEMEMAKLEIPKKDVTKDEHSVNSDDDFQYPPPKKINECSKKKQKVDSSTPVATKPAGKKQLNIDDAHTQTRTLPHRAAKAAVMKTPVFKPIPTRQASSSKTKERKKTTRFIFPQVQSKADSHVEEVAASKHESHVEKEKFISKKVFDAFREEGCTDLHPNKTNIQIDSQHLIPDELLQSINLDYNLSEKIVHHDDRFTIPDELLPSLNAYQRESTTRHPLATLEEEQIDEYFNDKKSKSVVQEHCQKNKENIGSSSKADMHGEVDVGTEEQIMTTPKTQDLTIDEKRDETVFPDSQDIIPDDLLPTLIKYHLSNNEEHIEKIDRECRECTGGRWVPNAGTLPPSPIATAGRTIIVGEYCGSGDGVTNTSTLLSDSTSNSSQR